MSFFKINRNDVFYKIIKRFQEESTNPFIKNYDTDDVYYILSRKLLEIMQEHIDSSTHEELQTYNKKAMEEYFKHLQ